MGEGEEQRPPRQDLIRFGVFEVNVRSGEIRKKGARVRLQEKPFQLLLALVERPGEIISRKDLQQRIWPDTIVEYEAGLAAAVSKVRRALGDDPDNSRFIETVPRRGYRFLAPVTVIPPEPLPSEDETVAPRPMRRRSLLTVGGGFVAAALFSIAYRRLRSPVRRIESIAVLPFENLSGDPDQEFFSDGLTDAVITEMAGISALKVISRTSVMEYKGARQPLQTIADELSVDAVLEGSVQREKDRVRVTAQLIEAATDTHLWADSFDRPLTSILALQGELARQVAREIHVHVTPEEANRLGAPVVANTDAYETYLRGRAHANRLTPEGLQNALNLYQAALEIDPNSALTYAGLADVLRRSMILALMEPTEAGPKALAYARRAIELDPDLSQGLDTLACLQHMYEWDWDAAETSWQHALLISPNNADAHAHLSLLLTCLGRFEEAEQLVGRALELDPLNLLFQHTRGVQYTWMGEHEKAVRYLAKVVARAPFMQMSHLTRWASFHALGRIEESFRAARAGYEAVRDEDMVETLDRGQAQGGFQGAMARAADLLATRSETIYVQPHIMSLFYDFAGETESVFECIEQGYRRREHAMSYINRKPFSARVKNDPRYAEILARMNLPR